MAAGLGFKDFVTGEVLTAADVDGYLMQGIWVFASAAARDSAVTSPQEGNFAYLKDTNTTTYYTGSAWTNLDTTGMVNPMTTTGDTIYSSSGSTPARLGIGSTGQVLTVAGGVPSWATPTASGANFSLLNSGGTDLTGAATVTVSGISGANKILILVAGASSDVAGDAIRVRFNTDTANNYTTNAIYNQPGTTYNVSDLSYINTQSTSSFLIAQIRNNAGGTMSGYLLADGCNSSGLKIATFAGSGAEGSATAGSQVVGGGTYSGSSTISSISVNAASGNLDAGKVYVYTSA